MDVLCLLLQKELQAKFLHVSSIRTCKIRNLTVNKKYPIIRAERAMSHLGHTVLLTILEGANSVIKVFLPKRYACVVSDSDITHMNVNPQFHSLVYRGFDSLSRYTLHIEHM